MLQLLRRARVPAWALSRDWPLTRGEPALADIRIDAGRIDSICPCGEQTPTDGETWDLAGVPLLPALVDPHVHFSQAFTRTRTRTSALHGGVGLLAGIEAMFKDRATWTHEDLRSRIQRALQLSWEGGVVHLRSHTVWAMSAKAPLAWSVEREMAEEWSDRVVYERVLLARLTACVDMGHAQALAKAVAAERVRARLGAFVHTSTFDVNALRNFFRAAQDHGVGIDLHIDEDLNPTAQGMSAVCNILEELSFESHVACSHACALSAQPESVALHTLDAAAKLPITLIACPMTNLLMGDAASADRTPRLRGFTLVKEARARCIPVLFGSDSAQDPYISIGACDAMETLFAAVLAGQLDAPFDTWTDSICRAEWLNGVRSAKPLAPGAPANLVLFPMADAASFPSRAYERVVLRAGRVASGAVPPQWAAAGPSR